jgi:hypothetical protein
MDANTATAIAAGMVVLFPPGVLETNSVPQTAATATATHIATIARAAHISVTSSCTAKPRLAVAPVGGCEIVDISLTSFLG